MQIIKEDRRTIAWYKTYAFIINISILTVMQSLYQSQLALSSLLRLPTVELLDTWLKKISL